MYSLVAISLCAEPLYFLSQGSIFCTLGNGWIWRTREGTKERGQSFLHMLEGLWGGPWSQHSRLKVSDLLPMMLKWSLASLFLDCSPVSHLSTSLKAPTQTRFLLRSLGRQGANHACFLFWFLIFKDILIWIMPSRYLTLKENHIRGKKEVHHFYLGGLFQFELWGEFSSFGPYNRGNVQSKNLSPLFPLLGKGKTEQERAR